MCPFSSLAFLQPTTVDKEPKTQTNSSEFFMISSFLDNAGQSLS